MTIEYFMARNHSVRTFIDLSTATSLQNNWQIIRFSHFSIQITLQSIFMGLLFLCLFEQSKTINVWHTRRRPLPNHSQLIWFVIWRSDVNKIIYVKIKIQRMCILRLFLFARDYFHHLLNDSTTNHLLIECFSYWIRLFLLFCYRHRNCHCSWHKLSQKSEKRMLSVHLKLKERIAHVQFIYK